MGKVESMPTNLSDLSYDTGDHEVIRMFVNDEWTAEVCQGDYIGYWITFHSGLMDETGACFRWTQRGALRCARRGMARRDATDHRRRWIIRNEAT